MGADGEKAQGLVVETVGGYSFLKRKKERKFWLTENGTIRYNILCAAMGGALFCQLREWGNSPAVE